MTQNLKPHKEYYTSAMSFSCAIGIKETKDLYICGTVPIKE